MLFRNMRISISVVYRDFVPSRNEVIAYLVRAAREMESNSQVVYILVFLTGSKRHEHSGVLLW